MKAWHIFAAAVVLLTVSIVCLTWGIGGLLNLWFPRG